MRSLVITLISTCLFMPAGGCHRVEVVPAPLPEKPKVAAEAASEAETLEVQAIAAGQWLAAEELPLDEWYVQHLGGKRIGFYRTQVTKGTNLYRIRQSGTFEFSIAGTPVQHTIELESLEYPDGELASFTERTITSDKTGKIEGQLVNGRLTLQSDLGTENPQKTSLKWEAGTWGVLGIQSMLRHSPMKPGEARTCNILVPRLKKIVTVELLADQPELTTLPGGATGELIPINVLMRNGEQGVRSRNWVNEKGEILKTVTLDEPLISTFRAPPEVAQRIANEMQLSTLLDRNVKFFGIAPEETARTATYVIESSNTDLYTTWDKKVRQSVTSISALSSEVVVHDILDAGSIESITQDPPNDTYLASTSLVQSDHRSIGNLADSLSREAPESSVQAKVLHVVEAMSRIVKDRPLQARVAGALETARRLEGDSPAQAILLCAVLRKLQIPARIASGLKVDQPTSRLRFHMWTEAWLGNKWLPVDAMTGGVTRVDCIKVMDSSLANDDAYAAILPIFDKMDEINVRIAN